MSRLTSAPRPPAAWISPAAVLLLFFFSLPSHAGEESSIPENPEITSLRGEIHQLENRIAELEEDIEELISPSQVEEKEELKREIVVLKRQVHIKTLELKRKSKSDLVGAQEIIRLKYEGMLQSIEATRTAARRETIARIEGLFAEYGADRIDAGVMLRLAQLYFEESHEDYNRLQDAYENTMEENPEVEPPPPLHDYSRSIDLYEMLIEQHPNYEKIDVAHYLLAYCLVESGDEEGALQVYEALLAVYPKSSLIPEAHVRVGEIYFERGENNRTDYHKAIKHYQQVREHSPFYDKALYKLGWTYYKMANVNDLGPLETAIDYFTQVLAFYESRPTKRLAGSDDLRKESIDYIAISFCDYGDEGIDRASAYFEKVGRDEWNRDILRKMTAVFFDADDSDNGGRAAHIYLETYPYDAKNPQVHILLVDALNKDGRYDEAISESERIAELYAPGSPWAQRNEEGRKDRLQADRTRMGILFASATYHHEMAQKAEESGDRDLGRREFQKAIRSYEIYTRDYPDAKEYYTAMFNMAESYYATGAFLEAGEAYREVGRNDEAEFYKEARLNLMKALEMRIEGEGGLPNKAERERLESGALEREKTEGIGAIQLDPVVLSAAAREYVKALEDYAPEASSGKSPGDYYYRAAYVLFWHGYVDVAVNAFRRVMADYPGTDAADSAKYYALEGTKIAGNLEQFQRILRENPSSDAEMRKKEADMASTAGLILATRLIDEGRHHDAIRSYMNTYNENPRAKDAPAALHNVAVIYEKDLHRLSEAAATFVKLAEEYPEYEKSAEDLFHAANNYERLTKFRSARTAYERFVSLFADHAKAKDALYNAAALAIKDHDFLDGADLARGYAEKFPQDAEGAELFIAAARAAEEAQDHSTAMSLYREYTTRFSNNPAHLVEAHAKVGAEARRGMDMVEAQKQFTLAVGIFERFGSDIPQAKGFAAQARFLQSEALWQEYQAMAFTGDMAGDAKVLENLARAYKELDRVYGEVAAYADFEWFSAALHRIGMINREFSEALFQAPVPEGLEPEMEDEYISKLEDIALPIKDKAIGSFLKNVAKGNDEGVRNQWIDKSAIMLRRYNYKFTDKKPLPLKLTSLPSFAGGDFVLKPKGTQAGSQGGGD